MPQVKTSKPLTYYIDNSFVRGFLKFAGESLENLDIYEVWDLITALCQSVSLANQYEQSAIDTSEAIEALDHDVALSHNCTESLGILDGFPTNQVNILMKGILSVAFDEVAK